MTFLLSMLVGMLSHPALLLFFKIFNDFRYLVNGCLMKIVQLSNAVKSLFILSLNVIGILFKIGIERICNCFRLSNVNAVEFNGGID